MFVLECWCGGGFPPSIILGNQLAGECDDFSDDPEYQRRDLQLFAVDLAVLSFAAHVFHLLFDYIIHEIRVIVERFSKICKFFSNTKSTAVAFCVFGD